MSKNGFGFPRLCYEFFLFFRFFFQVFSKKQKESNGETAKLDEIHGMLVNILSNQERIEEKIDKALGASAEAAAADANIAEHVHSPIDSINAAKKTAINQISTVADYSPPLGGLVGGSGLDAFADYSVPCSSTDENALAANATNPVFGAGRSAVDGSWPFDGTLYSTIDETALAVRRNNVMISDGRFTPDSSPTGELLHRPTDEAASSNPNF